jgi:hypothetical protein
MIAVLPLWKGYLYSLAERIRIYRLINSNQWRFGFSRTDVLLLRRSITKYVTKGGQRKPRAHIYNELIDSINEAMGIATQAELELAMRLNVVKLLNVEELIMEMKDLKKFAAEVGLTAADMAGLDDMHLAKAVCDAINPEKGYSAEFIAWYDSVPDGAFDNMDGVKGGGAPVSAAAIDAESIDNLITHINGLSKAAEFKELLADGDVGKIFEGLDCSKFKLAPQYKKAMIEHLEALKAAPPAEAAPAAAEPGISNEDLAKAISKCETVDELIAIVEANQAPFEGLEITDTELEPIKATLVKHLGVDLTPKAPPASNKLADLLKKKQGAAAAAPPAAPATDLVIPFDPAKFDPNVVFEAAGNLQIGQLRKFYKQVLELSPAEMASEPGMKKDLMLDQIATGLVAIAENGPKVTTPPAPPAAETTKGAECTTEINSTLIKAAVDASDKDGLIAMCESAGIKLNALQKRSIPQMEKMLNEKFPASAAPPVAPPTKATGKLKLTSKPAETPVALGQSYLAQAFGLIESMTLAKSDEAAIVEAVLPIYASAGKTNKLIIKSRVKQLMEIVAVEHGLKAKK